MAHLYGICHRNCALKYDGGILELRKLDFMGLKVQFDVKKANYKGLIPIYSYSYKPILTSRTQQGLFLIEFVKGIKYSRGTLSRGYNKRGQTF